MNTRRAVTAPPLRELRSSRSAFDAQPVPRRPRPRSANEFRKLGIGDADKLVQWLNASIGTSSHKRVVLISRELDALRSEFDSNSDAYHHASGGDWPKDKHKVQLRLHRRHGALNDALEHYIFRPRANYVLGASRWLFGMVPDNKKRQFQMQIDHETISEADAVLSLIRLSETGDLKKVKLCAMCKTLWVFAAKQNYRFCSDRCREDFYVTSPDYHSRKAANQRRYREQQKLRTLAEEGFRRHRR